MDEREKEEFFVIIDGDLMNALSLFSNKYYASPLLLAQIIAILKHEDLDKVLGQEKKQSAIDAIIAELNGNAMKGSPINDIAGVKEYLKDLEGES